MIIFLFRDSVDQEYMTQHKQQIGQKHFINSLKPKQAMGESKDVIIKIKIKQSMTDDTYHHSSSLIIDQEYLESSPRKERIYLTSRPSDCVDSHDELPSTSRS